MPPLPYLIECEDEIYEEFCLAFNTLGGGG